MADMNIVPHPSDLLLSELTVRGMRQKELSVRTGATEKHISTIVSGSKPISVSFGRKLDIALGDPLGTWAKRQADYDNYMARLEEENGITSEENRIYKRLSEVVAFFIDKGIMYNNCGDAEKILQLRQILCVNNLTVIPQITYNATYRAQINKDTRIDPCILFAWQRMCELKAANRQIDVPFSARKLSESIPLIKQQMFAPSTKKMTAALRSIFASCGIAFEVVHNFRRAPVQGFIKQVDNTKVILCVTLRGKAADRFWFSLFHEVGHLLNGDLGTRFVDFESVGSAMEDAADSYARDTLLDPSLYNAFIETGHYHSLDAIKEFATTAGVPHWIVIGRLHKDEYLDWSCLSGEIPAYRWAS